MGEPRRGATIPKLPLRGITGSRIASAAAIRVRFCD
jgi:hypothetical protein